MSNAKAPSRTAFMTTADAVVATLEVLAPPVIVISSKLLPSGLIRPITKYLFLTATHVSDSASRRFSPGSSFSNGTPRALLRVGLSEYDRVLISPSVSDSVAGKLDGISIRRKLGPETLSTLPAVRTTYWPGVSE